MLNKMTSQQIRGRVRELERRGLSYQASAGGRLLLPSNNRELEELEEELRRRKALDDCAREHTERRCVAAWGKKSGSELNKLSRVVH